jgi:hypothetical protein
VLQIEEMAPPIPGPVHQISNENTYYHVVKPITSMNANSLANAGSSSSNSSNFWEAYEHLCSLQSLMPIQSLKASLMTDGGTNLQFNADKLKSGDWEPLLGAIRVNKCLKTISVYSQYSLNESESNETSRLLKGYAKLKKPPAIRNKERINKLCRSLKECLSISNQLNKIELFNIPLSVKDSTQLAKVSD